MQGIENVGALASPGDLGEHTAAPNTFEARWDRWVAEGIRQDHIVRNREIGTLVILASTIAIVAVWLLVLQ